MKSVKNISLAAQKIFRAFFTGKTVLATPEQRSMRTNICELCVHFDERDRRCGQCKCFVDVKAAFATERCPEELWEKLGY